MPEFDVTERRWVLADYPYTVQAVSEGDALLRASYGDLLPNRASEMDWEVSMPCSWDVYGPIDEDGEGVRNLDSGGRLRLSRLGFIGVREGDG